jgi:hypothetical protein
MMKQILAFIIIVLVSLVYCTPQQDACTAQSNKDCASCVNTPSCSYCNTNKNCFLYVESNLLSAPCATADMQYKVCVGMYGFFLSRYIV